MKHLTIKALFLSAAVAMSMNVQAAEDVYSQCLSDAETVIATAKTKGGTEARALTQKVTVEACQAELAKIEAPYADKSVGVNPSSVMTPADRAKWSALFDAIDAKNFKGTHYGMASYYR